MFKQSDGFATRAAMMFCVMLFVLMLTCRLTLAQSQDPSNPTPITSGSVSGQAGPDGATYYYRFNALKGSVKVTLKGQTNYYATQFEADLLNTAGDALGEIYVAADDTAKSESKEFNFDSEQAVTIVVKLLKDSPLKWQKYSITFSGAVGFGDPGGGGEQQDNPPMGLPDLVFSKVRYTEGGKSPYPGTHTGVAEFCVKNIGAATAGQFQVRLTIYKNSDESSGLWREPSYFNFKPMAPGEEECQGGWFQSTEPIFVGRGRLLWIDPSNSQGIVKESNDKNNKSWTNFPPQGIN